MRGGLSSDMVLEKMFCSDKSPITNWGPTEELVKRDRPLVHLGWDIDGTYYMQLIRVKKVSLSDEEFDIYDVRTCASVGWETDNAHFSSSLDHSLLCVDAKFHTLEEVIDKNLWLQVARGNGHKVRIESANKRQEKNRVLHLETAPLQNFILNRLIHEA
jgi:hypothetical protein